MPIIKTQNDCNAQSCLLFKLKIIALYNHTIVSTQNDCNIQSHLLLSTQNHCSIWSHSCLNLKLLVLSQKNIYNINLLHFEMYVHIELYNLLSLIYMIFVSSSPAAAPYADCLPLAILKLFEECPMLY